MDRVWVVNASPLILLGKLGRTELLEGLAQRILVPDAVSGRLLQVLTMLARRPLWRGRNRGG